MLRQRPGDRFRDEGRIGDLDVLLLPELTIFRPKLIDAGIVDFEVGVHMGRGPLRKDHVLTDERSHPTHR